MKRRNSTLAPSLALGALLFTASQARAETSCPRALEQAARRLEGCENLPAAESALRSAQCSEAERARQGVLLLRLKAQRELCRRSGRRSRPKTSSSKAKGKPASSTPRADTPGRKKPRARTTRKPSPPDPGRAAIRLEAFRGELKSVLDRLVEMCGDPLACKDEELSNTFTGLLVDYVRLLARPGSGRRGELRSILSPLTEARLNISNLEDWRSALRLMALAVDPSTKEELLSRLPSGPARDLLHRVQEGRSSADDLSRLVRAIATEPEFVELRKKKSWLQELESVASAKAMLEEAVQRGEVRRVVLRPAVTAPAGNQCAPEWELRNMVESQLTLGAVGRTVALEADAPPCPECDVEVEFARSPCPAEASKSCLHLGLRLAHAGRARTDIWTPPLEEACPGDRTRTMVRRAVTELVSRLAVADKARDLWRGRLTPPPKDVQPSVAQPTRVRELSDEERGAGILVVDSDSERPFPGDLHQALRRSPHLFGVVELGPEGSSSVPRMTVSFAQSDGGRRLLVTVRDRKRRPVLTIPFSAPPEAELSSPLVAVLAADELRTLFTPPLPKARATNGSLSVFLAGLPQLADSNPRNDAGGFLLAFLDGALVVGAGVVLATSFAENREAVPDDSWTRDDSLNVALGLAGGVVLLRVLGGALANL